MIASKVLPRPAGLRVVSAPVAPRAVFHLDDVHVPAGFTTCSGGTPLLDQDAAFLWTAAAGMAVGAADRLTDELASLGSSPLAMPVLSPTRAAAELSALLHHERLAFTAERYNGPDRGRLVALAARDPLAVRIRRTALPTQHVVTRVYERAILFPSAHGRRPLESLVVDSGAVLQHLRNTVDLLPQTADESRLEGNNR